MAFSVKAITSKREVFEVIKSVMSSLANPLIRQKRAFGFIESLKVMDPQAVAALLLRS